ncbi:hypothetical protein L198_08153 [Cryptococcus wingfieldii CBS 7118]|uniref:Uncharacterized protein n=1 Tax=Cryptococcus wingfieldii CBS 7118 TaxID=1295528 RepID=A0A1E3HGZ4_9TREE|nr:hypothetical protein L198_08153 [Cryptococcus wingfieldii CBS 7118]ODN75623.1 hypothetical protein L198_08153 [Cryptococcus wingfieldii CBS 7118]
MPAAKHTPSPAQFEDGRLWRRVEEDGREAVGRGSEEEGNSNAFLWRGQAGVAASCKVEALAGVPDAARCTCEHVPADIPGMYEVKKDGQTD